MFAEYLYQINKQYENANDVYLPKYDPDTYVSQLATSSYWSAILNLRHVLKLACDNFFVYQKSGINIDLFMFTPSVSSPMGPGSDSEAVPIKFGKLETFLVDSSQFGFEPVLMNDFNLLYCYLPSMRGENPDKRHLNQFFHCEAEMRGGLEDIMKLVEDFIVSVTKAIYGISSLVKVLSVSSECSIATAQEIVKGNKFKRITFDDAIILLEKNNLGNLVNYTKHGRDITNKGEIEVAKLFSPNVPFWITHYDRDRVPFYQKPDPSNSNKVFNADLIFPSIIHDSFGGEIVGCGQRQDKTKECYESLGRQKLSPDAYNWYISLRLIPGYKTTSGFGFGVERYIAWILCRDDIKDVIPYPRLKNIMTYP